MIRLAGRVAVAVHGVTHPIGFVVPRRIAPVEATS